VQQLARALKDFGSGEPIRAVDEHGAVKQRPNGLGDLIVSDVYLREQFPAPGKARARSGGMTPSEQLADRIADLSDALDKLEEAFKAVVVINGADGGPLVAEMGVEPQFCSTRRQFLGTIGDELYVWSRTFRQRHGGVTTPSFQEDPEDGEDDDPDAYDTDSAEEDAEVGVRDKA
jgi:hypothetical protein